MKNSMKKKALFGLLIALEVCSCQIKEDGELTHEGKIFNATMEAIVDDATDADTKTSLDASGNVLWKQGDQVSIFAGSTINEHYQVTDASDGKTAAALNRIESPDAAAGGAISNNVAFYPYTATAEITKSGSGYLISGLSLTATQNYSESSFGNGAFPMTAVTSSASDYNLKFKNVLGGLKLQLKGTATIASISITGNNNEILCGDASVTVSNNKVPSINLTDPTATTVTLDCGDGVQLNEYAATSFIIALPPMTMSMGFTVTVTDTDGHKSEIKTTKSQTIVRSSLLRMPIVTIDSVGTDTDKIEGSRQDVILQSDFGGSGSEGDDVSRGSDASQGIEDSNKNGINYVYGNNTVKVTESVMQKISNLTKDGFWLPADSWGQSSVGHGDVFVFPQSEQFPGGYAAKITNVTPEGDGYYYTTTLAAIDEIFDTLHMEQSALDLTPYIEKIVDEDGTEVDWAKTKAGFSLSIPEIFGGINGLSIDINDKVNISPSAEISFNMDVDADVVNHKLTYARANVNTSARLSADVAIKNAKEKQWVSKQLKIIVAAIPVGPILVTPEAYVSFELKLTGEVNATFSFNYQKSYYAYTYYDGSNVYSRAGEAGVSDKEDPFAVSLNLSGGVELGPNVGVGLSIYGGALGLSVDFDPHAAFAYTGSLPFTMETWTNMGNAGMWLSNAYYEPSVKFNFGGSFDIAYIFHMGFDLPDNVELSYSFGKTFIIPKLGETLEINASQGGKATISTTIYNKAIFSDDMFVYIREDGPDGPILYKRPFTISRKPKFEGDEVNMSTSVSGLDPGTYYVDGPYITVSAFGYSRDVVMTPVQDDDRYFIINEIKGIDLGLPSGLKWATCNLGANAPEEYGDYYSWGGTAPQDLYSVNNCPFYTSGYSTDTMKFSKYNEHFDYGIIDNKTVLELRDDAAHVNWGGSWRIPTKGDWEELIDKCSWRWTSQNGVYGRLVTSRINGNSIFLPAAGYMGGNTLYCAKSFGHYWSSSLCLGPRAYYFRFQSDGRFVDSFPRYFGLTIRPVSK